MINMFFIVQGMDGRRRRHDGKKKEDESSKKKKKEGKGNKRQSRFKTR
jgi:hypothetical protein